MDYFVRGTEIVPEIGELENFLDILKYKRRRNQLLYF